MSLSTNTTLLGLRILPALSYKEQPAIDVSPIWAARCAGPGTDEEPRELGAETKARAADAVAVGEPAKESPAIAALIVQYASKPKQIAALILAKLSRPWEKRMLCGCSFNADF